MNKLPLESDNNSQSQARTPNIVVPLSNKQNQTIGKLMPESIPRLTMPYYSNFQEKTEQLYNLYERLFLENQNLNNQLTEALQNRNQLAEKFNSTKRTKVSEEAVKRKRRYARDIQRQFYCPIQKCHRGYGSEGSLSHHVRLKHYQFYESGKYEIFIQKFIDQLQDKKYIQEQNHHNENLQNKKQTESVKQEIEVELKVKGRQRKSKKQDSMGRKDNNV